MPLGYNNPNSVRIGDEKMFHKGLDNAQIIESAKQLIETYGYDKFSMRQLADKLGIKTASLYAHFSSMEALLTDVGLVALKEQKAYQLYAIEGKKRDEAIKSLALAYRRYAKEHSELYRFIMKMPIGNDEALIKAAAMVASPAMQVLEDYHLSDEQKMHWQRILRGMMHGFISQEANGYFSHYPVDVETTYLMAIQCLINEIEASEVKTNG